jgi:CRP-like cAMP-binding protein
VKLFMSSAAGKDCLIAIYAPGEIFGESCFTGTMKRFESASAMRRTVVLRMTRREFTAEVGRASLTEALLQHLASRSAERQTAVFDLTTMDSERRLAKVLLQLGQKLGKAEGAHYLIEQRISQEELAQIVGTTRPRVTAFMQRFRALGIIDTPGPRAIRIDRQAARDFVHRGE